MLEELSWNSDAKVEGKGRSRLPDLQSIQHSPLPGSVQRRPQQAFIARAAARRRCSHGEGGNWRSLTPVPPSSPRPEPPAPPPRHTLWPGYPEPGYGGSPRGRAEPCRGMPPHSTPPKSTDSEGRSTTRCRTDPGRQQTSAWTRQHGPLGRGLPGHQRRTAPGRPTGAARTREGSRSCQKGFSPRGSHLAGSRTLSWRPGGQRATQRAPGFSEGSGQRVIPRGRCNSVALSHASAPGSDS